MTHLLEIAKGGEILSLEPALATELGTESAALVGRRLDELVSPLDPRGAQRYLERQAFEGLAGLDQVLMWRVAGRDRHVRVVIYEEAGRLVARVEVFAAGSELLELVETRDVWNSVVGSMSDGLALLDDKGLITTHNEAFFRLVRPKVIEDSLVGTQALRWLDGSPLAEPIARALAGERHVRTRVVHAGRTLDVAIQPTFGGARLRVAHTVLIHDVSAEAGLEEALRTLRKETAERQRMETALHAAHRLEAVGQLAAGLAHEMNTPMQYVADTAHFLRSAIGDVVRWAKAVRAELDLLPQDARVAAARARIDALESELDVAYSIEQLPAAFGRLFDGVDRAASIVRAMREFAQANQRELAPADLNRAIETTLVVSGATWKRVADLETDLAELPPVRCHIADINQVLLHLIVNAAHAIQDKHAGVGKGRISIRTRHEDDQAVIAVSDTGVGIPESIRGRLFEPFFTTKEVGRGKGQGLAIARSIALRHGGSLSFESTVGEGSTFTLRLPVAGPA